MATQAEALDAVAEQLDDACGTLRRYLDTIEDDPEQLQAVEERLLTLADLKRKYGDTVEEILAYAERARGRLEAVERQDQIVAELDARREELRAAAGALAGDLSARRAAAAIELQAAVETELADLNMRGTRFVTHIERADDPAGLPVEIDGRPRMLAFDATGVDRVEFLIAPNPGEEPKGLGRIASGGELARVALALKTALSRVDRRATLIFDEVDTGVGGRSAPVVGEKLWGLTSEHQVLCVTHMPQVAAYADAHLVVAKGADEGGGRVDVRALERASASRSWRRCWAARSAAPAPARTPASCWTAPAPASGPPTGKDPHPGPLPEGTEPALWANRQVGGRLASLARRIAGTGHDHELADAVVGIVQVLAHSVRPSQLKAFPGKRRVFHRVVVVRDFAFPFDPIDANVIRRGDHHVDRVTPVDLVGGEPNVDLWRLVLLPERRRVLAPGWPVPQRDKPTAWPGRPSDRSRAGP